MKNFTKIMMITATVSILMMSLFESTKSVHAANYNKIGNNILKVAKR